MAEGSAGGSGRWRLVPVGDVGLGTYFTGVEAGMYGKFGWNLVDALGGASLRAELIAASSVGVGPTDGRSVDTKPFIGNVSFGFNVRHGKSAF